MQSSDLLNKAYSVEWFKEVKDDVFDLLMKTFPTEETAHQNQTIPFIPPENQLEFWQNEFNSGETTLKELTEKILGHSLNLSNKRNVAHQLSVTLPITMLTAAISARLNNVPTHYQLGMTAITMERIVIEHMLKKFGFNEGSTGTVVTGGSMGNLTALITARTKYQGFLEEDDFHNQIGNLAIMVSEVAHYSIERAAMVMGLKRENVIQLPINPDCTVRTDVLEEKLQEARKKKKIVFCIVGCASTTSHGAHDDLTALGEFAKKHNIWFHVDGAHGGCAAFSNKYKHLLKGIETCDSVIIDFHKMLMVPTTSTAILYNRRLPPNAAAASNPIKTPTRTNSTPSNSENFRLQPEVPSFTSKIDKCDGQNSLVDFSAPYLFNNSQSNEWYEGGYHTLECSKPTVIFHTYAILRIFGDKILEQNVDTLYDMGIRFGQLIKSRKLIKLALEPQNNIVCFRYITDQILEKEKAENSSANYGDKVNQFILDKFVNEGTYYLSSAPIFNILHLRVTFMNPFTDEEVFNEILNKVEEYGKLAVEELKI